MDPAYVLYDLQYALVTFCAFVLPDAYSPLRRSYVEGVVAVSEARAEDTRTTAAGLVASGYDQVHDAG